MADQIRPTQRCQAFLCNHPLQWHDDWENRTYDQAPTYCAGADCGVHRIKAKG